jgi:hypothetical protein
MKKNIKVVLKVVITVIVAVVIAIVVYGYNSGSCQRKHQTYICNDHFCLYKEFQMVLREDLKRNIDDMLLNKRLQKRVSITTYPETIFNCALPNKSGTTISTMNVIQNSPDLIHYYQNELCNKISEVVDVKVFPTSLKYPTSCCILIYENENDWINWHYDYNYYDGRFFTVLIPITTELTCTKFQFKNNENNEITSMNLTDNAVCFEGNYLYHRASKLCKNQKRVMLSCQFVTDNSMSLMNQMRIKIKDFAYIGFG